MTKWIFLFIGILIVLLLSMWLRTGLKPVPDINVSPSPTIKTQSSEISLQQGINETDMPLVVSDGIGIGVFASGLNAPRDIDIDNQGTLLVSLPKDGRVVALPDADGDGAADEVIEVATGLNQPHGIVQRCDETCLLWIAETDGVTVFDYDPIIINVTKSRQLTDLPAGGRHWTRSIMFHPNDPNILLVSVGSSCDVCVEDDWRRATVMQLDLSSNELSPYVTGMRNAVFMAVNPIDQKIWVTEMGRDRLGDDLPPEELNILQPNLDYGWPYCYGKQIHDTQFDNEGKWIDYCATTEPAAVTFQAHSAPLGLAFVSDSWPGEYSGDLLVAYHGSWNRSIPTGYKIARFTVNDEVVEEHDFVSGWLTNSGEVLGRPVDVFVHPNGDVYVSDDDAGMVYRIWKLESNDG